MQIPPMVSAVRIDGKRLHELARAGIEVERQPRPVTVYSFDVAGTDDPSVLRIEVRCSAGTYIRTLADDLGRLLGGGAHLRNLRRTAVGSFTVDESPPDECVLMSPLDALRDYARVDVDDPTADMVRHGRVLDRFAGDGPWAVVDRRERSWRFTNRSATWQSRRSSSAERLRRPSSAEIASSVVQLVTSLDSPPWKGERTVLTIGAYDGVHRGHLAIIEAVRRLASASGARSAVMTFDRHPASVVRPESAPKLLTDLDQKLELLAATGLDATIIIHFDEAQSREEPAHFVRRR